MHGFGPQFKNLLFGIFLIDVVEKHNPNDPLIILAREIDWKNLCDAIGKFYDSEVGRPSVDLRIIIGIIMLQNIYNFYYEAILEMYKDNIIFQAFSGAPYFSFKKPFHQSTLTNFRKRIGKEGLEIIFAESVRIHGATCLE
jgi:IS5 family transposase